MHRAPSDETADRQSTSWWSIVGIAVGFAVLAWVFWRIDYGRMREILVKADVVFVVAVPAAIAAELLVRGWKWRQILYEVRPVGVFRLFGATLVGYLANVIVPLGISPIVRSWLIARLEGLKMSAVLATVAIDRFIDGVVFVGFVLLVLGFAVFPDPDGGIRTGLMIGGAANLVLFSAMLYALARYKRSAQNEAGPIMRWLNRLPNRYAATATTVASSFAQGIVWPRQRWRAAGIVVSSIVIKLVAITHFVWAGLAFDILLKPADYVFLVVFLGFLIVLSRFVRIPGGFIVGAIFALDLLGVDKETALAMTLLVHFSTLMVLAVCGSVALWRSGFTLSDLRNAHA